MGRETREEISRLERRLAELRQQEDIEQLNLRVRKGAGSSAPMPGPVEEAPPLPLAELQIDVESIEADREERASQSPRQRASRKRRRPNAKKAKRMEQAVVGVVVLFFGSCMALVATQGKDEDAGKTAKNTPKDKATAGAGDEDGEAPPSKDEDNLAPDPSGVCQMLVSAGVAESCGAPEASGEGERVAVFELAGEDGGQGRVRTFDTSARCQQAGGPGGGHWYARCDARTAIVIPSHVDAEGTLAARRVASRL